MSVLWAVVAEQVALVLPYPPALNHLYRAFDGKVLLSREGRAYKEQVGWLALAAQQAPPLRGPVVVELVLYRPRKAGDIDGPLKVLLDALEGHLWANDRQIVEMHVYRKDDKHNPRVEVRAWEVKEGDGDA